MRLRVGAQVHHAHLILLGLDCWRHQQQESAVEQEQRRGCLSESEEEVDHGDHSTRAFSRSVSAYGTSGKCDLHIPARGRDYQRAGGALLMVMRPASTVT